MKDRMTASELKEMQSRKGKVSKFKAQRVEVAGIKFDSKKEAARWAELKVLERAGVIRDLELQVPIMLEGRDKPMLTRTGKQMKLTVDFTYIEVETGLRIFNDSKGMPTRDYEVRKSAAEAMGIKILET